MKKINPETFGLESVIDYNQMAKDCEVDVKAKLPPPPIALSCGTHLYKGTPWPTPFGTYGNFSCLVGQSKSLKTFLKSALVASYIGGKANNYFPQFKGHDTKDKFIIDIDTEQSVWHTQRVAQRTLEMVGGHPDTYKCYSTRKYTARERFEFVQWMLTESQLKNRIGLIIVDGAADITDSVNDLDLANQIVQGMLQWTEVRNCHLMTVLHANPGSRKPTGHLGTAITKKAETVAYVSRENDVVTVSPDFTRNYGWDEFEFRVNEDSLPEVITGDTDMPY